MQDKPGRIEEYKSLALASSNQQRTGRGVSTPGARGVHTPGAARGVNTPGAARGVIANTPINGSAGRDQVTRDEDPTFFFNGSGSTGKILRIRPEIEMKKKIYIYFR